MEHYNEMRSGLAREHAKSQRGSKTAKKSNKEEFALEIRFSGNRGYSFREAKTKVVVGFEFDVRLYIIFSSFLDSSSEYSQNALYC